MSLAEVIHRETEGSRRGHVTFKKSAAMTGRDYLVTLLHIAAEAEHGLMVQYLYAAYSLGGPHLDGAQAATVAGWQKNILDVAKEEMGHLLTVQNLLALLGAPPNFTRAEGSFEQSLSPIPFFLEPLTREVAASFTFAEMSQNLDDHLKNARHLEGGLKRFVAQREWRRIDRDARGLAQGLGAPALDPQPVARLYEELIRVFSDDTLLPDRDFDEMSYASQASWDDWGRGYGPNPKLLSPAGDLISAHVSKQRAHVLVMRAATRTDAIAALREFSGQGEAVHVQPRQRFNTKREEAENQLAEPSHFERFLAIWQGYPSAWKPYRNVMINPVTRPTSSPQVTYIEDDGIRDWAMLFNLRYRMLLTFLAHSFRLSRVAPRGQPNLRGMIMHRAFGEMYNIKTIAGLLVQMKVSAQHGHPDGDVYAGPPFETPYSLNMPAAHVDVFRLHRDLYRGAIAVNTDIQARADPLGRTFLVTLLEIDSAALRWIDGILRAPGPREATA